MTALPTALEALEGVYIVTVTTDDDIAATLASKQPTSTLVFHGATELVIVEPLNDPKAHSKSAWCDRCKRVTRFDGQTCSGCKTNKKGSS